MTVDKTLPALPGDFTYPLRYGYSAVGRILEVGEQVQSLSVGRLVLAFNPHESAFISLPTNILPLPGTVDIDDALFFPNMESSVNFVMDGGPLIGEHVAIFGQGIVGLLTASLLKQFPITSLVTVDPYARRRQASLQLGATASLDPGDPNFLDEFHRLVPHGADLTFELSGEPAALNQAIVVTGFDGRIVIGSWYGTRSSQLDLGGYFHRSRIRLISSQVSSIAPSLLGRWDRERRYQLVWKMLSELQPSKFITHRIPFEDAQTAYELLSWNPEEAIQVILTYPGSEAPSE